MRTVELVPGIRSSVLGFGCAPILGAVGGREASRALGVALDEGITHFDLARSYGYGDAERFVGRYLRPGRDQVVIVSKFGIRATWLAGLLRPAKPMVRACRRWLRRSGTGVSPTPKSGGEPRWDPFHQRVPMDARHMRQSLEQSLRALGTDYLDLLLLHEPEGCPADLDGLCAEADKLKRSGKIRAWGAAFDWGQRSSLGCLLPHVDVLQFECSPGAGHFAEAVGCYGSQPCILFSVMRHRGGRSPAATLQAAWAAFPRGVVVCSMFRPEHIRSNAHAAAQAAVDPACSPS